MNTIKKSIAIVIAILLFLTAITFPASVSAAQVDKNIIAQQMGFSYNKAEYVMDDYSTQRKDTVLYQGQLVGTTTIDYITGHHKSMVMGKKMCVLGVKVLTEPEEISVTERYLLFFTRVKKLKFGISSLNVTHNHYNEADVGLKYSTTADTATKKTGESISDKGSISLGGIKVDDSGFSFGIGFDISSSVSSTMVRGICDCDNRSVEGKTNLTFRFGNPTTNEQKQRVYEQTYYYISESILAEADWYQIQYMYLTSTYKCDTISASKDSSICIMYYAM